MTPSQRRYTVVLADDVSALRRLVRIAAEGSGRFQVIGEATTGLEAIERAREHQPDLVLLDLSMPDLDGLEALPRVLEASPKSHVVVLSGFNHVRMAPVAKRLGASAYLEKGLEPDLLVRALLDVLEPGGTAPADAGGPKSFAIPPIVPPQAASPPPRPPSSEAKPGMASFRVLLVESDGAVAQRLANLMASAAAVQFQVTRAATLAVAAADLEQRHPDVVVVDPRGLGGDAEEDLIEILGRAPGVPVVALAPPHDVNLVARALRLGIEDCLDPDVNEADLLGRSLLYAVERRRAQEARRRVRDQEAELERMRDMEALKTQFFNAAAHELGNPLTPIRVQLALLRRMTATGQDPAASHAVEILERNVQRMSKLNQDILDVARLQAGRLSLERHAVDVKGLVRELVDTFEPLARDAGIGLTATCPEGLAVDADPQRIMQVLYNLAGNALKFTPSGGLVAVEVRADGNACTFEVRDSGPGLGPDQIAKLFQPFSQVLGDVQPRGVGSGLGLFVSRGIVELHNGHIACRSPGPGRGCTFTFTIPRLAAQTPAQHEDAVAVAAA
ncbi:MAG: response regulator [Candidatus Thermoplasmatota archaeon]